MNKKTKIAICYFSALSIVTIGLVISIIRLGIATQQQISEHKKIQAELEQQIEEQTNSIKEQKKAIKSYEKKLKETEAEKQEQLKLYEELNEKYQEEIKPVSYNSSNLLSPSGANERKLSIALKGTGLEGLESAYVTAEKEYGVNAIFLCALTAEESAWGTSNRAVNQNNMSGFEVYSDDSIGAYFNSKYESIMVTARLLKEYYLTPEGEHFNGYDIYSVNIKYSQSLGTWAENISSIAYSLVEKINK